MTYAKAMLPLLMRHLPLATILCGNNLQGISIAANQTVKATGYWTGGMKRFVWERAHLSKLINSYGVKTLYTPYQVATQPKRVASICALRNLEPFFAHHYTYTKKAGLRNEILRHLTKRDLTRADVVIAVSDFARDFAVESLKIPQERIVRIYHGRDESLIGDETETDVQVRHTLNIKGRYILTAGSILPYRRVEDIIAAFDTAIASLDPDAKLIVAGTGSDSGYKKKLERVIAASQNGKAIRLIGYVGRPEMRALYKGCDIFVSASEIEACPNIGIEAMTAGCAVIAADAGPAREIYGDGAAFYVPRNTAGLTNWMRTLWCEDRENQALRTRAVVRSRAFSWSDCAKRTAELLQSV
ncbi:MAG: glycosyltransferase family 1 protein [Pseudomonadota bacterium]